MESPRYFTLTQRDILTHYPKVYYAVAWTELLICQSNDKEETSWDLLMSAELPIPPQTIVEMLVEVVESESIEDLPTKEKILQEMKDSQYLTYIKAKAGCV